MEEVTLRFSHLGEKIFAQLDNVSLARSREVSKPWKTFLDQQKFLPIRSIQLHVENKYGIGEPWKTLFKKSNTKMITQLNSAVKEVYSTNDNCKQVKHFFQSTPCGCNLGREVLLRVHRRKG